jgi:hypothetical protein
MNLIRIATCDPFIPAKAGSQRQQALEQMALDPRVSGGDDANMKSLG